MDVEDDIWPKVGVGCSGCLTLSLLLTLLGSLIVKVALGPRASWDEVLPVAIPSGVCCLLSLIPLAGAIYWIYTFESDAEEAADQLSGPER